MIEETSFAKLLNSLPYREHKKLVGTLAHRCHVQRQTIYNWKAGTCRIPVEKVKIVEDTLNEYQ